MNHALLSFFVVSVLVGCAATDTLEVAPEDCAGIPNGTSILDECGVCDGDGSSCADCAGVPNGDVLLDACGVCDGDGSSCADCAGVPNGDAMVDACGVCAGDGSSCADCAGVPYGDAVVDACGVCAGDGSRCADCAGVPNGPSILDACGVCEGDGSSCADCAGVPNGDAVEDECGVCGGDGSSCAPSVTITPEADALVNSYSPGSNYGFQEELRVDRGADESFLRFDLAARIPTGATIERVTFKTTAYTGFAWGGDGTVYTYLVEDDTWSEDSINWNNRPSVSGESLGSWWLRYDYSDYTVRVGEHSTDEMTAAVQSQLNQDGLLSVRLHSPGCRTNYRAREYADASMRPRLEVTYRDCAGIQSGDAFLDNCGDCVGGTTGLEASDCSEPEPEPEPEIGFGASTSLAQQGSCGGASTTLNCPAGHVAVGYQGQTGA